MFEQGPAAKIFVAGSQGWQHEASIEISMGKPDQFRQISGAPLWTQPHQVWLKRSRPIGQEMTEISSKMHLGEQEQPISLAASGSLHGTPLPMPLLSAGEESSSGMLGILPGKCCDRSKLANSSCALTMSVASLEWEPSAAQSSHGSACMAADECDDSFAAAAAMATFKSRRASRNKPPCHGHGGGCGGDGSDGGGSGAAARP
mmetsp:Transcript_92965/g.233703  ORF Transcript_92965/g.233703 Transcript_92965/m.233703 type:complete len:203 (+) Transcript_92965:15-623(+)